MKHYQLRTSNYSVYVTYSDVLMNTSQTILGDCGGGSTFYKLDNGNEPFWGPLYKPNKRFDKRQTVSGRQLNVKDRKLSSNLCERMLSRN